jgi:AcrR family transcriptional regulator
MAGRPREFDRELALRQMQTVFWERGYDETSITDLVAATGLASARLYAAFGPKEAMFRTCIDLYRQEEGGFADRALAEESTVRGALSRMFHEAATVYSRPTPRGCMIVSAATSCASADDGLRDWLQNQRRRRTDAIKQRLVAAIAAGELPADLDARAVGDALAALLHGLSVQARDGVPRRRLVNLIPAALGMLGPPDVPGSSR